MPKREIQQRLLVSIPPRQGRRKVTDVFIRLQDIAAFIGVQAQVLRDVAHKRRDVDDALQFQLSAFFALQDSGRIVKVFENGVSILRRVPTPPGVPERPRATIDVSSLRINWSWSRHP